jgi:hypothetical protein
LNLLRAGHILALMNILEALADEFEGRLNVIAFVEDEHQDYEVLRLIYPDRQLMIKEAGGAGGPFYRAGRAGRAELQGYAAL